MKALATLLLMIPVCLALIIAFQSWTDTPEVWVSNSTKQCVKVVSKGHELPCSAKPDSHFEIVWVK